MEKKDKIKQKEFNLIQSLNKYQHPQSKIVRLHYVTFTLRKNKNHPII